MFSAASVQPFVKAAIKPAIKPITEWTTKGLVFGGCWAGCAFGTVLGYRVTKLIVGGTAHVVGAVNEIIWPTPSAEDVVEKVGDFASAVEAEIKRRFETGELVRKSEEPKVSPA